MVKELGLASARGRYYLLLVIRVFSAPSQWVLLFSSFFVFLTYVILASTRTSNEARRIKHNIEPNQRDFKRVERCYMVT
uniref:Uncharacterized protein n=1 Tax=Arundo donax TaxID=35708 RepID=A0A0A9EU06_ARUDO